MWWEGEGGGGGIPAKKRNTLDCDGSCGEGGFDVLEQ